MIGAVLVTLGLLGASPQGGPTRTAPEDDAARVARAVAGRLVLFEVTRKEGDAETVAISQPAFLMGPRTVMTVSPRLAKAAAAAGASVRIVAVEPGGKSRRVAGRLVKTDPQTGLAVLQAAEDLDGALAAGIPLPTPPKDSPVYVVEPSGGGRLLVRKASLLQTRALLDQGRGKNPLLLVQLLDRDPPGGRSYANWDDDRATGAGAILVDARGGFLGLVTPPVLEKPSADAPAGPALASSPSEKSEAATAPQLKEGEILALPGEIARLVSESLAKGKAPIRGYLGASFREVVNPPDDVRRAGRAPAVRVEKVYPGGPADEGGLKKGDWLLTLENRPIAYADVVRLSELVEYGGQGKTIHLLVARAGATGQLSQVRIRIKIGTREG